MIHRLEKWAKDTGISSKSPCKVSYGANIVAELGEMYVADKQKNINEVVDAVADIIIFSITEIFKCYKNYPIISAVYNDDEYYESLKDNLKVYGFKSDTNTFMYMITKELHDVNTNKDFQYLFNIVNSCYNKLISMGYDIRIVMNEVMRVLESRTGSWSDEDGKWIKDTSPEAKAKWYEPDYSIALEVLNVIEINTSKK